MGRTSESPDQAEILRSVIESLPEGIIVADSSGSYRIFNSAAQKILGLGPLQVHPTDWARAYGYSLFDGFIPYPADQLPLGRALRGEEVRGHEIFVRNEHVPKGRWIETSAGPWRDASGTSRGAVVLLQDIDEKKAARELNARLLGIVEQTTDSVLVSEADGTIAYVNPSFERLMGFSRDEVIGRTPRFLRSAHVDGQSAEDVWPGVLAGSVFRGILVHRRKNGETVRAQHVITPVSGVDGRSRYLVSVAQDITARAEGQKQRADLDAGQAIQQRLYPKASPRIPGFDIAGAAYPAESLCGDLYDFFPMLGGGLGLTVADVCGHGIGPSILMAQTRAYLRLLARTHADVGEILGQLNEILAVDGSEQEFVTQLLVRLDPTTRELVYSNAGHPPGILIDGTGAIRDDLRAGGIPLGLYADRSFPSSPPIRLETGDVLVLFTDGLTECRGADDSELGRPRVLELIRTHRHRSAAEILASLLEEVACFREGPPLDDMTFIVVKTEK